jgi:hypothetical protein
MEHAALWASDRTQELIRQTEQTLPGFLDQKEFPDMLLQIRRTTNTGFPFSMTLLEYEKIHLGSLPELSRSSVVNKYYELINYFNQLDFSNPSHINNFMEWQTWWINSLDLILPQADLVAKYNNTIFKGDANMTDFDKFKYNLGILDAMRGPLPFRDEEPIMLDLASELRTNPFKSYKWNYNIETNYDRHQRLNSRAGNKYKRTKKYRKSRKSKKSRKSRKYKKSRKSRKF